MELNFPKLEGKILKFWKENGVFKKSISQRKGARDFVFYEGPPSANAKAGLHHVLARVFKDLICRYKTMQGFRVLRKAGWDTHGLPIEVEAEKKLGLKNKKDIERFGIVGFNKACQKSVWKYKEDWEKLTERIGFWLDMENPYITYQPEYIETLWWIIKKIYQKGLFYQDYKVVPYCPRCQTTLSLHEVAQGYQRIREPALYLKFKITNSKTYLLVWTTTPWTLPGNVAIAVNPNFSYAKIKVGKDFLILAKERIKTSRIEGKIVKEFKGKDLIGLEYQPLYPFTENSSPQIYKIIGADIYKIIGADFVSLEEGTGLVHIAPAFGQEDMIAAKGQLPITNYQLPITVDEEGKMVTPGYKWDKIFVKDADPLIIEDLKKRGLLFREEEYEHDYPFCWRCNSPLIYYAKKSWFVRMSKVKKELIENNKKINWIPSHLKEGRFGEWLREIKDWALSRERYWGTPLPIWKCKGCGNLEVIGSKKDLLNQKFTTNKYFILRHGQTIYQTKKKEKIYPLDDSQIKLTKEGKKEIKNLAKKLKTKKIDLIYSSPYLRAKETAQILAKEFKVKIIFDKRLKDINLGVYHGRRKKEFFQKYPTNLERFHKKPEKGENWSEVKIRILDFIKEIDKKHQGKIILIVSHGDPLWLLAGTMKGLTEEEFLKEKYKNLFPRVGQFQKIDFKIFPYNEKGKLDFHRPYIDEVKFFCQKCNSLMERVPEVIDCWFDSGAMPFAQYHYPFENKKLIDSKIQFPADFICEAVDQTRGWFYTLLAVSTLLGFGTPYRNVISLGLVLDKKGEKMSKSKGNVVDPWEIIEKYGTDALRWYFYTVNQPGEAKLFSEKDVELALKKFVITFWNSFSFFQLYANMTQFLRPQKLGHILDRWIISRLNELILEVSQKLAKYDLTGAARAIENFVISDLSLWYIRRSRKRFQKPKTKKEINKASNTLGFVLLTLSKLTAPFVPFLSEEIYQSLTSKVKLSVHLENWPKVNKRLIDQKLNQKMKKIREIVALSLAERARAKIKVRQPLKELKIKNEKLKIEKELLDLIREEVNVKKILFDAKIKKEVKLDTKITPKLKEEGQVREVIRNLQEMRKKAGFKPKDKISIYYFAFSELRKILTKNKNFILKETKAKDFVLGKKPKQTFDVEREVKIDQQKLWLAIKKV